MPAEAPTPPILPASREEFEHHFKNHAELWLQYLQDSYTWINSRPTTDGVEQRLLELQIRNEQLQEELGNAKEKESAAVHQLAYVEHRLDQKEQQLQEAKIDLQRALEARMPTVTVSDAIAAAATAEGKTATPVGANLPPTPRTASPSRLSEKLPDPERFQANRADYRRFRDAITEKMTINADRYNSPASRIAYTNSRLISDAYAHIQPYIIHRVCSLSDYTEILDILKRVYGDPNEEATARRKLLQLRQTHRSFADFYAEFARLAVDGSLPEEALPIILENAVSREIKEMCLHNPPLSRDYKSLVVHFQNLDTRYREHKDLIRSTDTWRKIQPVRVTGRRKSTSPRRGRSPPTPRAPTPVGDPMDLNNQRRPFGPSRKDNNLCFRCGSDNHFIRDCTKPDIRRTQLRSAAVQHPLNPAQSPSVSKSRRSTRSPSLTENEVSLA